MDNNFLIDSHCHLNYLKKTNDLNDIIKESNESNVKIINNICTSFKEIEEILAIGEMFDNVYCSVGIHPSEIDDNIIKIEDLMQYINNKKVKSIGECGLDYHFDPFDKQKQIKTFEMQIEVARQSELPLIIHSRDCDSDMINILENEMKNGYFKFVLHCFCSGKALAYKALDLDGYISFSGIVTFKNSVELQNLSKTIPLNKMLLETDSPFLAPTPNRGKENKPAYIKYIAEYLSILLNIPLDELSATTTQNFKKLFSI